MRYSEYPENFARFYDLIYHELRDGIDNEFFLDEIKKTGGSVLEVGVGTGRLFLKALKLGADIYGIDVSKSMIRILSGKLREKDRARISIQNLIDFNFNFPFSLVLAPFRVIMHLTDKSDQLVALNNVYNHLKPGGKFIFDTFVPDLNYLIKGLEHHVDFEGEYEKGKKLKRIVSTRPDLINQLIHVHFRLEWEEKNNVRSEEWDLPLRFFFRYELEHLIERSYFEKYQILGDFEGNRLAQKSKEFIVICRKE
jgi:SAM-dependent methyltransferase